MVFLVVLLICIAVFVRVSPTLFLALALGGLVLWFLLLVGDVLARALRRLVLT